MMFEQYVAPRGFSVTFELLVVAATVTWHGVSKYRWNVTSLTTDTRSVLSTSTTTTNYRRSPPSSSFTTMRCQWSCAPFTASWCGRPTNCSHRY